MTRFVPALPPVRTDVAYIETLIDEELAVLDDAARRRRADCRAVPASTS